MRLPTLKVASLLLRTNTDGVCSRCRLVTLSSALTTAAAFLPRKVQPSPELPVMLPAMSPQISRPSADGNAGPPEPSELKGVVTAFSKYQLTPYSRSPVSC